MMDMAEGLGLDDRFRALLNEANVIAAGLDDYVAHCTSPPSAALTALETGTREENWRALDADGTTSLTLEGEMLSGHVEGQFLKMLIHATGARDVLEIGMFTGYSALAMAEAVPDGGSVTACEIDPYAAKFARGHFDRSDHGDKIAVEVGPAAQTLTALADKGRTFDFVFIDADKAGYQGYLDILLDRAMLTPNALICVDNTLMQGQPYRDGGRTDNGRAIARFNMAVANDDRLEQVLLPIRDGVTLIRCVR